MKITLLAAFVSLSIVGCSSSEKKEESKSEAKAESMPTGTSPETAKESDSGNVSPSQVDLYPQLREAVKKGNQGLILKEVSVLLARDKNDLTAINALAMSYYRQGKYEMAEAVLTRGFSLQPKNAKLLNNLGLVLLKQDKGQKATVAFRRAHKLDPGNLVVKRNLANIYSRYGDYAKAGELYETLVSEKMDPRFANNVAVALWKTGRVDTAADLFEKYGKDSKKPAILYSYAVFLAEGKKDLSKSSEVLTSLKSLKLKKDLRVKVESFGRRISRRLALVKKEQAKKENEKKNPEKSSENSVQKKQEGKK